MYLDRTGCAWRYLPADFPPWQTVYGYFAAWRDDGTLARLHARLRAQVRTAAGRQPQPTAAVIDSQSVRAADTVPKASRGWDNAKKVNGRKRHIAVDTTGLLLEVLVTPASTQDRDAARPLLFNLHRARRRVRRAWADSVYAGKLQPWAATYLKLTVDIVKRPENLHTFEVLPRRWVVERTFAWLVRYRRLVRCYERRPDHHEALVWWATVHLMTRRLTRELSGQPPAARWGGPPPLPELASPDRRGKILELLAAQPWRVWRGVELAAILEITNVNSFRVQLSQWAHQGYINKIGPALYAPACTS